MDEWGPIVAGPLRSQYQSKTCKICGLGIRYGQLICKLATSGKTTQHGQGPGVWVHEECADWWPVLSLLPGDVSDD